MADVMRSSDITPELVLVDPELAELARAMLGEPGELPPHARPQPPAPEPELLAEPEPVGGRPPVVPPALLVVPPAPVAAPAPVRQPEPVSEPEPEPVGEREAEPVLVAAAAEPATAPPAAEPAPAAPAKKRIPVFFTTLLAASLALNVALVLEIYRSSGETAPVTVIGAAAPADDLTPDATSGSGASSDPPATTPATTPPPPPKRAAAKNAKKQQATSTRAKTARAKAAAAAAARKRATETSKPTTTKQADGRKPAPAREAEGISLSWDPAEGATFYNVVLWRDDTRLLDLWPTDPSVRIPESWTYRGRTRRLEPGRYLWFAFAGYGSGEDRRLGGRVASGDVVVPPA
jgi:hypothetical protein